MPRSVFVTGATGYLGQRLIPALLRRGHSARALVRPESAGRLAAGALAVLGNALDCASFADRIAPADTFVQLVGTPRPSPAKARQFREVDLVSVREERFASTRETALRLGLLTREQMVAALVAAIEHPPAEYRTLDVPAIRAVAARAASPIGSGL